MTTTKTKCHRGAYSIATRMAAGEQCAACRQGKPPLFDQVPHFHSWTTDLAPCEANDVYQSGVRAPA